MKEINISLEGEPQRLDLPDGQLFFGFPLVLPKAEDDEDDAKETSYKGEGHSLRKSSKRKGKKDHASEKATKAPRSPEVIEID